MTSLNRDESSERPVLRPYRFEMEFTVAARSQDDAEDIHEALVAFAKTACIYYEMSTIEEMALDDVIPDSPLGAVLRLANGSR